MDCNSKRKKDINTLNLYFKNFKHMNYKINIKKYTKISACHFLTDLYLLYPAFCDIRI